MWIHRSLVATGGFAGLLLLVGSGLDWSGVEYSSSLDRRIALLSGIASICVSLAGWFRPGFLPLLLVAGALGTNMGVVNYLDIDGHLHEYAAHPEATVGLGVYLVLAGGLAALVAGLISLFSGHWRVRSRRASAP